MGLSRTTAYLPVFNMPAAWGYTALATLALAGVNGSQPFTVRLLKAMSNVANPADDAYFTESTFPGYAAQVLPAYTREDTPANAQIGFTWPMISWTVTAAPAGESIVGWGIYESTTIFYLFELASPIPVSAKGQVIGLSVSLFCNGT
jgi:hypothetical protein